MRVLLIEDTPADAELIQIVLGEAQAVESVTWSQRLPDVIQDVFDLAILDLGLVEFSGAEAFHELRRRAPNIATLVCTGCSDPRVLREVIKAGATVVSKDRLKRDLVATIDRASAATPAPEESIQDMRARTAALVEESLRQASESGVRAIHNTIEARMGVLDARGSKRRQA